MIAVAFLHPLILWGLVLGSIPIIIHLFHRRKFHVVMWGAMAFLISSSKLKARRLKILQLLLLLTRIMIVLLIVAAIARPHLTGQLFAGFLSGEKTASVILLDTSLSMSAKSGDTAFERAQKVIAEIAANLRRSDSIALVSFSNKPVVVSQGISDPETLKSVAEKVEMTDAATDIHSAIEKALSILQEEKVSKKEIFLITDGRKNGWKIEEVAAWTSLDSYISKLKVQPKLHIIDVGAPETDNAAISFLEVEAQDSLTAGKYALGMEIQSFGVQLNQSPSVKFFADDMNQEQARIKGGEYENGISKAIQPFKLDDEGFHKGKVELVDVDQLQNDNIRYFSINHRKNLPILCVEGVRSGGSAKTAVDFVRIALAPEKSIKGGLIIPAEYSNVMAPELISFKDLYSKQLSNYEAIILTNNPSFPQNEYEALKYFILQGGGLAIFLGKDIELEKYNSLLDSDKNSFLPGKIESLVGNPSAKERKPNAVEYVLSEFDYNHPVLKYFRGGEDGDLTLFKYYAYYKIVSDETDPDIKILARFNTGDPFMVERKVGRGKVVMIATEPTVDWSNMGARTAFLPLMHHLMRYLASDSANRYNLLAGEKISYPLQSTNNYVTVINPGGVSYKLQPELSGDDESKFPYANFDNTSIAGIYTFIISGGERKEGEIGDKEVFFAVNPDPQESDLTVLEPKVIKNMLKNININYIKYGRNFASRVKESRQGKEVWRYLIISVLALLVAETSLAYMIDKT